jgi:hypothetical protein
MSALEQLLQISSAPLIEGPIADGLPILEPFGALGGELYSLLSHRNGFYAFESALHVFPSGQADGVVDLTAWNAEATWRIEYGDLAKGCLFFAEDAFGFQFCLARDEVCSFDPETGRIEPMARSLEEWSAKLLVDFRVLTGQPLAHEWQVAHGPLAAGMRLAPRTPFVLGGDFVVENLHAANQVELMRFRGHLASQIKDLPDGAQVKLTVTD